MVDAINDDSDNEFSEFELDDIVKKNQFMIDKCIVDKHVISKRFKFNPKDQRSMPLEL